MTHECISKLYKKDGNLAISSQDKAELLASFFSQKMRIWEPDHPSSTSITDKSEINTLIICIDEVKQHFPKTEINRALRSVLISLHFLLPPYIKTAFNSKSRQLSGNRLELWLFSFSKNLLRTEQFDFKSRRSVFDLLLQLVTSWSKSLVGGKETRRCPGYRWCLR